MNRASNPVRSRNASFVQFLMLLWLLVLSVAAILGQRWMSELDRQEQVETGLRQLHGLESRVTSLGNSMQLLQVQPEVATAAALEETRLSLSARLTQLEQSQADHVSAVDLKTLRMEIEQLKARPTITQAASSGPYASLSASPSESRALSPARAKPATPVKLRTVPFPYRVLGIELRAGQPALSIAPAGGTPRAEQLQVLLPGESVGRWRLETIGNNTAVFRSGQQTRRLAIP